MLSNNDINNELKIAQNEGNKARLYTEIKKIQFFDTFIQHNNYYGDNYIHIRFTKSVSRNNYSSKPLEPTINEIVNLLSLCPQSAYELDFNHCGLKDTGVATLIIALINNNVNVAKLDLSNNHITNDSSESIAELILKTKIKNLSIAIPFCSKKNMLEKINLDPHIHPEGGKIITKSILKNDSLIDFNRSGHKFDDKDVEKIKEKIKVNDQNNQKEWYALALMSKLRRNNPDLANRLTDPTLKNNILDVTHTLGEKEIDHPSEKTPDQLDNQLSVAKDHIENISARNFTDITKKQDDAYGKLLIENKELSNQVIALQNKYNEANNTNKNLLDENNQLKNANHKLDETHYILLHENQQLQDKLDTLNKLPEVRKSVEEKAAITIQSVFRMFNVQLNVNRKKDIDNYINSCLKKGDYEAVGILSVYMKTKSYDDAIKFIDERENCILHSIVNLDSK